ncbi:hypothetical protein WR25_05329 isoform B [Diploscapter pachys]|uniref:PDZ domain-containing protein n=1 Tax=Diploscapter pachys TaxID=2018661 RepID=A0A2A2M102_9BILA|nr:hypothetical protein WR25_05329 isoform B [Diploscapter pachys]
MRAAGVEQAEDVDLFSLVNIMTVSMISTRPTPHRMGQMARNQLRGRDHRSLLMLVYEELMGDEDENQLDDGEFPSDMEDDDLLNGDHIQLNRKEEQKQEESRAAAAAAATAQQTQIQGYKTVRQAVDFEDDEDEKETRGASTSSGNSTQKDSSPFGYYDEEHKSSKTTHNLSPLSEDAAPSSSNGNHQNDFSIGEIGSPIGNSTRLNESFIEEKSIDLSTSSHKSITKESEPIKMAEEEREYNPFDDVEDNVDRRMGTLSGRDPFENVQHKIEKFEKEAAISTPTDNKKSLAYRLSASSDEIVEARIDDEDTHGHFIAPSVKKTSYFEDIVEEREPPKMDKEAAMIDEIQKIRANRAKHHGPSSAGSHGEERKKMKVVSSFDFEGEDSGDDEASEDSRDMHADRDRETDRQMEVENRAPPGFMPIVKANSTEVFPKPAEPAQRKKEPEFSFEEEVDEDDVDRIFAKAKQERERSDSIGAVVSPIPAPKPPVSTPKQAVRSTSDVTSSPLLPRRNSLVPARISGRQSKRGKRKTRAIPEFYDLSRYPSIRLKAPTSKKKKMTIHKVEDTEVIVELLNGQKIEIGCRSDAIVSDIYFLVVHHMNLNEHIFFGLSFLRDGEHFFLDENQRLEKFAPAGWKSATKMGAKCNYVLHLRFRFYPQILDFIKTEMTMHELYLQARRDVIEERIQPKRDAAFELAALALQAEFGNRPPTAVVDYFDNHHYLLCQRHADFGCHLHRVFRTKPTATHGSSPFDPDTGSCLWIGIHPRGIRIYEEQGGVREIRAEHQWQETQTLQFDKKKFVIIATDKDSDGEQIESIFYTDHHTKSSYFVKFAASQHRFMIKMRQWKSTLRAESAVQQMPDVSIEGRPVHSVSNRYSHVERFEVAKGQSMESDEIPGMQFEVTLTKDPQIGLGLTLVDGNLNGVKGVYVKSVVENGPGMRAGLCVGDRLLSVDGVSLEGGDRHRAVELVRAGGQNLRMDIARLDGVVRHEKSGSRTPPPPRRVHNKRQRAVSDFGAIGDALPTLDSDNLIDSKAISGLHLDESDEEKGEYRLPTTPMYHYEENHLEEEMSPRQPQKPPATPPQSDPAHRRYRYARRSNMDRTDDFDEKEEGSDGDIIRVKLARNAVGSLGVQIASIGGQVCIKQLTAEPAISHPDLRVGDKLVSVNGIPVESRSHQEVVAMLRGGGDVVTLGLIRQEKQEDLISATLEKHSGGTLGVSLAKRTGVDGIYIRMIAPESAASAEGSLRVGDRLVSVDGMSVEGLTPMAILEKLKNIDGPVTLVVTREHK